jgi:hypothetical protein
LHPDVVLLPDEGLDQDFGPGLGDGRKQARKVLLAVLEKRQLVALRPDGAATAWNSGRRGRTLALRLRRLRTGGGLGNRSVGYAGSTMKCSQTCASEPVFSAICPASYMAPLVRWNRWA